MLKYLEFIENCANSLTISRNSYSGSTASSKRKRPFYANSSLNYYSFVLTPLCLRDRSNRVMLYSAII